MPHNPSQRRRQRTYPALALSAETGALTHRHCPKPYNTAREKIEKDFVAFCANGSGWILDRVDLVSVHIAGYDLSPQASSKKRREREQKEFEETL